MSNYDFIIVGSGPSGGVLAYNLNKSGAKVLLIEAGKHFRKNTFPKSEADQSAQLYWGGGLEFDASAKMIFLRAKVVGGTSIVNQALLDRFDDIAFQDWKAQSGVDFFTNEKMSTYYDQIENYLSLHTFTQKDLTPNGERFTKSFEKLGHKWSFLRRGQSDCAMDRGNDCLACLGGCHRDSKQSTMATFIADAEKNKLEIMTDFQVDRFDSASDNVTVHGIHQGKKKSIKGQKLILAGGSFGSTGILYRSGLKASLQALGKHFTAHPQFMSFGVYDEVINAHKGPFQTVASKDPAFRAKGFKLENVFAPPIAIAMLFHGTGKQHQEIMRNYTKLQCIEVAVRDEAVGEITVDKKGKLVVKKNLTAQDLKRRDDGLDVVDNILHASGAKRTIRSPYYFGLHLMGGCAIGTDGATSVVDPNFNVHGLKNVFIADSSIYPNAPGVNPSLTIMALSQKLSNQLTK